MKKSIRFSGFLLLESFIWMIIFIFALHTNTKTIQDMMERQKKKTGADLAKCVGILKDDGEYDKILEESRSYFKKWAKRYA